MPACKMEKLEVSLHLIARGERLIESTRLHTGDRAIKGGLTVWFYDGDLAEATACSPSVVLWWGVFNEHISYLILHRARGLVANPDQSFIAIVQIRAAQDLRDPRHLFRFGCVSLKRQDIGTRRMRPITALEGGMLRDLFHKRIFIMDAVTARSMASFRHGNNIDTLGEVDEVTSIHGKVFLSSAVQAIPRSVEQVPAIIQADGT
jgi:hypothetical protein